jgi:hypothetical protein
MPRLRAAAEIEPVPEMLSSGFAFAGTDSCAGLKNEADPEPRHHPHRAMYEGAKSRYLLRLPEPGVAGASRNGS